MSGWRPRVLVCGTKFGRIYLAAFRDRDFPFELAGILALGSARSRACAEAYGVPLFTDPADVPAGVDIACVVIGSSVNGGRGAELARTLMARGMHVLQEHPLHERELVACLREARQRRVYYHLNTHYVHIAPVRRFIAAARELFRRQRPLFIDAICSVQTAFTLWDILGEALGGVRPWAFADPLALPDDVISLSETDAPFRCLAGVIAGVPITLRVQTVMDPADPDNYVHVMHRITVGTEGGTLTLANTHGPVLWCPRAHMPADVRDTVTLDASAAASFDIPSAGPLGPPIAPTYREILGAIWPQGVRRALTQLREAIETGRDGQARDQYHIAVARLWQDAAARIGPVKIAPHNIPRVLAAEDFWPADWRDDHV